MKKNLTHRQVEILYAVISTGSMTQAAAALHTSQPSISRDLKEIQQQLGLELFDRVGRSLQPTPTAMRLYNEIRRSYVGLGQVNNAVEEIRGNLTGRINLACLPAYATTLLPHVCKSFLAEKKGVHLSVHSFEQIVIANGLMVQHYDIGMVEASPHLNLKAMAEVTVGNEVCILPSDHPLASRSILEPQDFHDVDFVSLSETDPFVEKFDRIFEQHSVRRNPVVDTTTATAVCSLVASGAGVSIINPVTALYFANRGLVMRRFSIPIPYTIGIYLPRNAPKSHLTQSFIRHCEKILADVTDQISFELSKV